MIEKNKIIVERVLVDKDDLSKLDYHNPIQIQVTTEFDPEKGTFEFSAQIPKHVYDAVVDKEEKYWVELAREHNEKINDSSLSYHDKITFAKKKLFGRKITSVALSGILNTIDDINSDAMRYHELESSESSKWLAIKWNHSHIQKKDEFNFADMGKQVASSFQWFVCYKTEAKNMSWGDTRYWKSKTKILGKFSTTSPEKKDWFYYGNSPEKMGFTIIKWTEDKEKFLHAIEDKFVKLNGELDQFLGDMDEQKLELLMQNTPKFLE